MHNTANSVADLACKPVIAMSEMRRGFCTIVLHYVYSCTIHELYIKHMPIVLCPACYPQVRKLSGASNLNTWPVLQNEEHPTAE